MHLLISTFCSLNVTGIGKNLALPSYQYTSKISAIFGLELKTMCHVSVLQAIALLVGSSKQANFLITLFGK
jgi:hypothetical protein